MHPEQFREMSIGEIVLAIEGYQMANSPPEPEGVTWNEVLDVANGN